MNGFWNRLLHPTDIHAWRWRGLTVWIVLFSAIVAMLLQQHHEQVQRAEDLAKLNRTTNARQQATIVMLCDRGYIMLGLIESAIQATRVQLQDDLKTRPKTAAADVRFIRQFQSYHAEIVEQLTDKDSPCVIATR